MGKKQTRRRYTDEFKEQAVLLAKSLGRTGVSWIGRPTFVAMSDAPNSIRC